MTKKHRSPIIVASKYPLSHRLLCLVCYIFSARLVPIRLGQYPTPLALSTASTDSQTHKSWAHRHRKPLALRTTPNRYHIPGLSTEMTRSQKEPPSTGAPPPLPLAQDRKASWEYPRRAIAGAGLHSPHPRASARCRRCRPRHRLTPRRWRTTRSSAFRAKDQAPSSTRARAHKMPRGTATIRSCSGLRAVSGCRLRGRRSAPQLRLVQQGRE